MSDRPVKTNILKSKPVFGYTVVLLLRWMKGAA